MAKIFESDEGGRFGVESNGGGVIYDAMFDRETAARIAQLESQDRPPADWEETREILEREGFPLPA
jgi:hypothetical protein